MKIVLNDAFGNLLECPVLTPMPCFFLIESSEQVKGDNEEVSRTHCRVQNLELANGIRHSLDHLTRERLWHPVFPAVLLFALNGHHRLRRDRSCPPVWHATPYGVLRAHRGYHSIEPQAPS